MDRFRISLAAQKMIRPFSKIKKIKTQKRLEKIVFLSPRFLLLELRLKK